MLTQEVLKQQLTYDNETGIFYWAISRPSCKIGKKAGCKKDGYIKIAILGIEYFAHRLAWLYEYGEFPDGFIDHINCIRHDNRISNLRIANKTENNLNRGIQKNNTSGYKGVTLDKRRNVWTAKCGLNGKTHNLGYFLTPELAYAAYCKFADEHHGEFKNLCF